MIDKSLFPRLRRLFSTDVIIRNAGANRLKVMDVERVGSYGALQTNSLVDRFTRLHKAGYRMQFNPTLNYQTLRLQLYADYEAMDTDGIVSAVLDIICEESTLKSETGEVLKIRSSNDNIQDILKYLFYDVLNIEFNLPMWIRSMCKYGDLFLRLEIAEKYGIYGCRPLSVYDMIREEGQDPNNPSYIRFVYDPVAVAGGTTATKNKEYFENYEVAHFRLLTDTNYLPFGRCLTANSYIETDKGVKTIDKVEKDDNVWTYNTATDKYELSKVLKQVCSGEKETLKIFTKNNFIEGSYNHPVLVYRDQSLKYVNLEDIKIDDLIALSDYSYREEVKATKINVDLGEDFNKNGWKNSVGNIPEYFTEEFAALFGFLIGDGWITGNRVFFAQGIYADQNAKYSELLYKFSGTPIYHDDRKIENTNIYSQSSVGSKMLCKVLKNNGFVGKFNEKRIPAWVYEQPDSIKLAFIEGFVDADGSIRKDKWGVEAYTIEVANKPLLEDLKILLNGLKIKSGKIHKRKEKLKTIIRGIEYNKSQAYSLTFYPNGNKKGQAKKYKKENIDHIILDPVVSIEKGTKELTYDIQVESTNSNFVANGMIVHNSYLEPARKYFKQYILMMDAMLLHRIMRAPEKRVFYINVGNIPPNEVDAYMQRIVDGMKKAPFQDMTTGEYNLKFNVQNMLEDFYIPIRPGDNTTKIDTTKGLEYSGIEDVEFMRDLMLGSLKVPKSFLNYSDELNGKSTISALDMRFSRTIERIQRIIMSELQKIAMIHLYVQGYEDSDLANFELELNNPSIIYEQEKIALLKEKTALASDMKEKKIRSTDWIDQNIFDMSEDEITQERDLIVEDTKRLFRLSQIENEGNDPAESGESYGTPHDLATVYNRNDGKEDPTQDVPSEYDEFQNLPGPVGRPKVNASFYNTDKSAFGRDPLGKKGMKDDGDDSPITYKNKPKGMALEGVKRQKALLFKAMNKKMMIFEKKEEEGGLLDERNIQE